MLFWVLLSTVFRDNLGSSMRLFNDYYDRMDFFLRGQWLPMHAVPYRDVASEYPQVATFLFGILFIPFLNHTDLSTIFLNYSILFAFVMLCLYVCLSIVLKSLLPPGRRSLLWALLLPAPLYFAYNRFDVLPSLLVVTALWMVRKERWEAAALLLGVGGMTKWYPALLIVPVVRYMLSCKIPLRRIALFVAIFLLTCLIIVAPTYLAGGVESVLSPYGMYNNNRGFDSPALPALLEPLARQLLLDSTGAAWKWLLFALQLVILPVVMFVRLHSFEKLVSWCILLLSTFMIFSRIYSPQWLLWILPLMILVARNGIDTAVIIVYGLLTYVEYPILHIGFGQYPVAMSLLGWMNIALLVWISIRAGQRLAAAPAVP